MSKRETDTTIKVGPGFLSLLTLLFVGLKLTGYINWSWFWVLSPLIFGIGLWLIVVGFFVWVAIYRPGWLVVTRK